MLRILYIKHRNFVFDTSNNFQWDPGVYYYHRWVCCVWEVSKVETN